MTTAGRPPLGLVAVVMVGLIGWVGLVVIAVTLKGTPTTPPAGFDLELLLRAGRDVAAGRSPYDPALVAGTAPVAESLFYSYPPLVAQAMAAFAAVPPTAMLILWDAAAVAGLGVVAVALVRRLAPQRSAAAVALPVVAAAPLCFPLAIGLVFGNLDVFFPLLYGATLVAVLSPATLAATRAGGIGLATAALTKLHPASVGVWFAARSVARDPGALRVIVTAIVVGLAVLFASVAIGGVGPWSEYLAVVRAGSNADLIDPRNAGPAVQLAIAVGRDDAFARAAQIGVTALVVVITLVAARTGGDPVERLAWAAAASLAALPVTWFHYPSAMIPFGLAALLRAGPAAAGRVRLIIAGALLVAAVAIAAVPLIWIAIGLVLAAVRLSRPESAE
jgi:Glycosyltransferase family 87